MKAIELYNQYFVEKDFERFDLFQHLAKRYGIERALYPGSFIHVTPSFVYPVVSYVDTDKRAKKFFNDPSIHDFVARKKIYTQDARITFYPMDYRNDIEERDESFGLLISQYSGFVSQSCKRYLGIGGLLLANNSHGDASMASIDDDYELVAVVSRRNGKHRLSEANLDSYFKLKSQTKISKEHLEKIQRGVGYKKSASAYVFERLG